MQPCICFVALQVMHSYYTASVPEPGRPWELQPDGGLQVSGTCPDLPSGSDPAPMTASKPGVHACLYATTCSRTAWRAQLRAPASE